eukprot:UN0507
MTPPSGEARLLAQRGQIDQHTSQRLEARGDSAEVLRLLSDWHAIGKVDEVDAALVLLLGVICQEEGGGVKCKPHLLRPPGAYLLHLLSGGRPQLLRREELRKQRPKLFLVRHIPFGLFADLGEAPARAADPAANHTHTKRASRRRGGLLPLGLCLLGVGVGVPGPSAQLQVQDGWRLKAMEAVRHGKPTLNASLPAVADELRDNPDLSDSQGP